MLQDGTILAAAHKHQRGTYNNFNSSILVYRVTRAVTKDGSNGVCTWPAPVELKPMHSGDGTTASPGQCFKNTTIY